MTRYTCRRWYACSLVAGFACAIAATGIYATRAQANPYDPPSKAKAQRIAGRAYDHELRPVFGRHAGITTRCRKGTDGRHYYCTVSVFNDDNARVYNERTRLVRKSGNMLTMLDGALRGTIRINPVTYFQASLWTDRSR